MQESCAASVAGAARRIGPTLAAAVALLGGLAGQAHATPALVGQWRFDEGSGQIAHDSAPLGLHGVLGSSAAPDVDDPLRVDGRSSGALRFSGGTHVRIDDRRHLDLQKLTVEAIARASGSPGAYRYLVAHGSQGCFAGAYGLYTAQSGGLAFYIFDGERYYLSPSAPATEVWDGAWHRVAGTFDGRTVRLFVDGREVGSGLATPDGTAIESESLPAVTYFGSFVGACRLPFVGDLDSVRIWNDGVPRGAVGPHARMAAGPPVEPASGPTVLRAAPPKRSCAVRASRKLVPTRRRAVIIVRARGSRGPLRRVRLSVRRTNQRRLIASPRTNAKGIARVVLKLSGAGRVRIGVAGRASCTPTFIRSVHRRAPSRSARR